MNPFAMRVAVRPSRQHRREYTAWNAAIAISQITPGAPTHTARNRICVPQRYRCASFQQLVAEPLRRWPQFDRRIQGLGDTPEPQLRAFRNCEARARAFPLAGLPRIRARGDALRLSAQVFAMRAGRVASWAATCSLELSRLAPGDTASMLIDQAPSHVLLRSGRPSRVRFSDGV